jgi:hypothetical protein
VVIMMKITGGKEGGAKREGRGSEGEGKVE